LSNDSGSVGNMQGAPLEMQQQINTGVNSNEQWLVIGDNAC